MALKDVQHVVPVSSLNVDRDGNLYAYLTDSMLSEEETPLLEWAQKTVRDLDDLRAPEHTLAFVLDLPTAMLEILGEDCGHVKLNGRFEIDADQRERLTVVRKQLEDSLALFDKIDYVREPGDI